MLELDWCQNLSKDNMLQMLCEKRTFMDMQSSLKKRCCAAQKGFQTSLFCAPVSSSASCSEVRRSCRKGPTKQGKRSTHNTDKLSHRDLPVCVFPIHTQSQKPMGDERALPIVTVM